MSDRKKPAGAEIGYIRRLNKTTGEEFMHGTVFNASDVPSGVGFGIDAVEIGLVYELSIFLV